MTAVKLAIVFYSTYSTNFEMAKIAAERDGLAAYRFDIAANFFRRRAITVVVHADVVAVLRQPDADRAADAARSARDQSYFAHA